jgi:ERCC4-type nuclease
MSRIIVDARESPRVIKYLRGLGLQVIVETISPADYVVSKGFAVERKNFIDFLRSIFDGRLFEQVERMSKVYKNTCLVVEGSVEEELPLIKNPLVFWGALAKIVTEWNVSVIFTPDEEQTAMFLHSLAKKLQKEGKREVTPRYKAKFYTLRQRQLLVVQSLPNIGPNRAEKLLRRFGSLRRILTASDKELLSLDGIGDKTVKRIKELLDAKYPGLDY